jgi:hypothetical protein
MQPDRILPASLGGLCAVLAAAVALELLLPVGTSLPGVEPVSLPPLPITATAAPVPDVTELGTRPLFLAARRPIPPEAPAPAKAAAPPPPPPPAPTTTMTLLGIVDGPAGRVALVKPQDGAAIRVEEGEKLGSWQVMRIEPDHLTLRAGDVDQDLGFPKDKPPRPVNGLSASGVGAGTKTGVKVPPR